MEYGTIKPIEITEEMRSAYLDYAMSVIVARALPDVRDGLKPVQRRIIYVMLQLGLQHTAAYKKSARIVGDTLGRYHPHGDAAVYDAMVRLAQDFSMRYPLVDGQGNFGCFTADTKVKLLDGTDRTFADLARDYGPDQPFYVYSIDENGSVVVAEGRNSRVTRRNAAIMELVLDNGEIIRCTPDHRFMLRDGSYKQAQDLTSDDCLMPGYFTTAPVREGTYNYRVVAKRFLSERVDVYDITVEPHHNFLLSSGVFVHNSVDGDPPAAQRYTEARLAAIAEELLHDIEKSTVDFTPNFDGTLEEPLVLPAGLPNLLLNGASGIAVGMATNIPPHNLVELCTALSLLIENPDVGVEELMAVMPGPDFPTGGIILGQEGIRTAYSTGKGRFIVRAKAHIEEATRGRYNIVLTELPYQVNKARLLERIADLVKQERLNDISDLRDESDRTGMRVIITLKREAQAEAVLNQLFKYTQMQVTFGVNLLALVDGTQPRVMTLKRLLQHYVTHRQEVIIRRTRHDLEKARNRSHILEGLLIALDFLDEVIETIRRSQTADTAKTNLMRRFKLTEIQAQAILDLQLRRLAALERKKIEEEYKEIKRQITELEAILANPRRVLDLIQADLNELRTKYGDARRTRITDEEAGEISATDLIPDVEVLVSVTERGFIRRLPLETYRRQSRGRRGQLRTREQDAVIYGVVANTKDDLLLFSDLGKCYQIKAHQLPDAERDPKGLALANLISLGALERIAGVVPVRDPDADEFIVLATRGGKIKRSELGEFRQARSSGIVAMGLDKGDTLVGARRAQGSEEVVVVTESGQAIRFTQDDLRPMGRSAGGVKAVTLGKKDRVIAMDLVCAPEDSLLTIARDAYGKRALLTEYPQHKRGGKGVSSAKAGQQLTAARVVGDKDEVTLITAKGVVVRLAAAEISHQGRVTRGYRIVELDQGDSVVALGVIGGEEIVPVPPAPPKKVELAEKTTTTRRRRTTKQAGSAAEKKAATTRRTPSKPAAEKTPTTTRRTRSKPAAGKKTTPTTTPRTRKKAPAAEAAAETAATTRRTPSKPAAEKTPTTTPRTRSKPAAEKKTTPTTTPRTRKKAPAAEAAAETAATRRGRTTKQAQPAAEKTPTTTRRTRSKPAAEKKTTPTTTPRTRKKAPAAEAAEKTAATRRGRTTKQAQPAAEKTTTTTRRTRSKPPAAEEAERPAARQLTLDEALPSTPVEGAGPPLIIRRMGRVLAPEDDEPAQVPDASPPAESPRGEGELLIRQLAEDPALGSPLSGEVSKSPALGTAAGKGTDTSPAGKQPAAGEKTEATPATREKRSTPKRTDVGISPVLSVPGTTRRRRTPDKEE